MIVEQSKKVHISQLNLIVGTKCNLHCRHCMGGDPVDMELKPQYIDTLIDNLNEAGIEELSFDGYEISLYPDTVKMVLDKLASANIRVDYLNFLTNGVIYSERLAHMFNDFRYKHTKYPEKAVFQVSTDDWHWNNGFTKDKLDVNVAKYRKAIGECDFRFHNRANDDITIGGRARSFKKEDIKHFKKVLIPIVNIASTIHFRDKCCGEDNSCNGGKCVYNCIYRLTMIPNGYLYRGDNEAFNAMSQSNYSEAIGHIEDASLFNIVKEYIKTNEDTINGNGVVFKDDSIPWRVNHLLWEYMKRRKSLISSGYVFYPTKLLVLQKYVENEINTIENEIGKTSEDMSSYCARLLTSIFLDLEAISELAATPEHSRKARLAAIVNASCLSPEHFQETTRIRYDLFCEMWSAYDKCDFVKYRDVYILIIKDLDDRIKAKNAILNHSSK